MPIHSDDESEESLNTLLQWLAKDSAWSCSRRTQSGLLSLEYKAVIELARQAEAGRISIRACRSAGFEYETLPPAFWKRATLDVRPDPKRIFEVFVRAKDTISPEAVKELASRDYVDLVAKWKEARAIWDREAIGRNDPAVPRGDKARLFPMRAAWLKEQMRERGWATAHAVQMQGGPEHRSVMKALDGEFVQDRVLEKLAEVFEVSPRDIPAE